MRIFAVVTFKKRFSNSKLQRLNTGVSNIECKSESTWFSSESSQFKTKIRIKASHEKFYLPKIPITVPSVLTAGLDSLTIEEEFTEYFKQNGLIQSTELYLVNFNIVLTFLRSAMSSVISNSSNFNRDIYTLYKFIQSYSIPIVRGESLLPLNLLQLLFRIGGRIPDKTFTVWKDFVSISPDNIYWFIEIFKNAYFPLIKKAKPTNYNVENLFLNNFPWRYIQTKRHGPPTSDHNVFLWSDPVLSLIPEKCFLTLLNQRNYAPLRFSNV